MNGIIIPTFAPSPTKRVTAYLSAHPQSTVMAMAQALGMNDSSLRTILCRQREQGFVRQLKVSGQLRWELGQDAAWKPKAQQEWEPKRATVTAWEPHMQRDPLVSALFGGSA